MTIDNNLIIVNNLNEKQIDQLHELYQKMWWSIGRNKNDIFTLLKTCIPFAVIQNDTQNLIGFARVLTDEMRYAYIFDVMTYEEYRNQGIGKSLMKSILTHPQLAHVKYFELTCAPDMVTYYAQFGFSTDFEKVIAMRRSNTPA